MDAAEPRLTVSHGTRALLIIKKTVKREIKTFLNILYTLFINFFKF